MNMHITCFFFKVSRTFMIDIKILIFNLIINKARKKQKSKEKEKRKS